MKLQQKMELVRKLQANIILGDMSVFIDDAGRITLCTQVSWAGKPDTIFAEVLYLENKGAK